MSIMTTFTRRSLAKNKVRTAVTVAGIALAAALLTAVLTSVSSLGDSMYRHEVATNGVWTAKLWTDDESAREMAEDPEIESVAVFREVGYVGFSYLDSMRSGNYLAVLDVQGDVGKVCGVSAAEGRLPEKPGEIMLPLSYKSETELFGGACEIGSQVSLDLGTRSHDGRQLTFRDSVVDSDQDGAPDEVLTPLRTARFAVVGFYDNSNLALRSSVGYVAVTAGEEAVGDTVNAYAVFSDPQSVEHIEGVMAPYVTGDYHPDLNYGILRHQGVFDNRSVWDTFGMIAVVLASIVILACVSLIYNAFGISVAERKRQFGLLASIGASRRQIAASVFYEAGLMAVAGIPLGILVGLAGTGAVLDWLAPMIERVLAFEVPFMMHVDLAILGATILFTLLTVFISAWIPALRASRATALEAIRGARDVRDVRAVPADRHGATGDGDAAALLKPRGLSFARLFGVPGEIARLNGKRGRGKGTAASVSLAVAVILLMTAGSFSTYMRIASDVMGGGSDCDLALYTGSADGFDGAKALYEEACSVEGVTGRGWYMTSSVMYRVPDAMATDAFANSTLADIVTRVDGGYIAMGSLAILEDAAFDEYARQCGLDPASFSAGEFKGIAVRKNVERGGERYALSDLFRDAGAMDMIYGGAEEGFSTFASSDRGIVAYVVRGSVSDRPGSIEIGGDTVEVPLNQVVFAEAPLRIEGLADKEPAIMGASVPYQPTAVVPLRAVEGTALEGARGFLDHVGLAAQFDAEDHEKAAEEISQIAARMTGASVAVSDYVASRDDGRLYSMIINVFTMLFTGILTLIAIANVFNTVTNSLILRRREFAVMRSIGMGNSQFRRMVACECLGYGMRGLIPGLAISVGVAWLLYSAMTLSMDGLEFVLPWGHMAAAACLVAVAMGLSVAYGLHRCRMDSVVEALRQDAV